MEKAPPQLKFGMRDLLWLMVVAALVTVIFTNMFAYRTKHRELMNELQVMREEALQSKMIAEAEAARAATIQKGLAKKMQQMAFDRALQRSGSTNGVEE